MAEFKQIIVSMLLLGIFAYALILGGITLIIENGAVDTLSTDAGISDYLESINDTLQDNYQSSKEADNAFTNSSITTTGTFPFIDAISGAWKTMRKAPVLIYDLSIGLVFGKLLSDTQKIIVISSLGAIFLVISLLAVWELISTGRAGGGR